MQEWLESPGPLLVSRSVLPLDAPPGHEERDAALISSAGLPVTLAGTMVDQSPAIVSNAVKSGYDAAQRVAAALADTLPAGPPAPGEAARFALNGATS